MTNWWEIEQAMWLKSVQRTVEVGEQEALDYVGDMDEETRNKNEKIWMKSLEDHYLRRGMYLFGCGMKVRYGDCDETIGTARRRLRAIHILRETEE